MSELRRQLRSRSYLFALFLVVVLLLANVALVPRFASPGAWADDMKVFAPFALLAMASTPSVLSGGGGLDVSLGPLANVVSIVLIAVLLPTPLGGPAGRVRPRRPHPGRGGPPAGPGGGVPRLGHPDHAHQPQPRSAGAPGQHPRQLEKP